ncbi:hypothetical protein VTK73DRAFT_5873 [Phialemonium thermophilum]|uniref:DUF7137 domain-containing protein n=1 Tax=Phialemonium thermophilum TaxID=223376 RepID=A0ABR3XWV8_9PEZI
MRANLLACQLATIALSLAPVVSAWPSWPTFLPDVDTLVVRADEPSSSHGSEPTSKPSSTASTETGKKTTKGAKTTNLNTGASPTETGKTSKGDGKGGKNNTTSKGPTHTMFNPEDPAGSVVMVTPAPSLGLQLYKIGDNVTWGWNYTNLQGTPTAIDVLVSCSTATRTWTLTQNMTFETPASYTWDTGIYQEDPGAQQLLTEMYTLIVYDSDSSISATAEAGYLAPFSGFTFGLYQPRAPTPLSEYKCAVCNAAPSDVVDRRALGAAVAMSVLTVLSFTWFVTGLGVFA